MEGDPCDHTPLSGFTNEILSPADNIFAGYVLQSACGGAPCISELGDLYGSLIRTTVCEDDACRQTPPC